MVQERREGVHVMRSPRTRAGIPLAAALAGTSLAALFAFTAGTSAAAPPGPAPRVSPGAAGSNVYYIAANGSVWTTDANPSASHAITALGGRLVSAPAPVSTQGDGSAQIVFGQGTDNQLWSTEFNGSGWPAWKSLGGVLTSKPGAVDVDSTTYSVFVRGTDGAVWERDHGGSVWGPWHSLGGQVLAGTGPAAAYTSAYKQTWVAVIGTDHAIWYRNLSSNIPQNGWASLGGRTDSSPGLTAPTASSLAAFVRGTNNAGFYSEIIGGAQAWHSIGGRLTTGLAASTDTAGATWVFGLGTDNQLYGIAGAFPGFRAWTRVPA